MDIENGLFAITVTIMSRDTKVFHGIADREQGFDKFKLFSEVLLKSAQIP